MQRDDRRQHCGAAGEEVGIVYVGSHEFLSRACLNNTRQVSRS
jgi:hypothetical protein